MPRDLQVRFLHQLKWSHPAVESSPQPSARMFSRINILLRISPKKGWRSPFG
jgi:hypothetical protein